jgi:soluble lytic murein transglycosylase-like protein
MVRVDRRTGKLVRTVAVSAAGSAGSSAASSATAANVTPLAKLKAAPEKISTLVQETAKAHDVDPLLVESVMQVESNFNPYAVSPKGAEGLMQLMPSTSRMLGVRNSFDPAQNIEAGVRYLKYLKSIYNDDRLALAAYNAGPKAVEKFKEVPPYKETQNYVEKVGRRYQAARAQNPQKQDAVKAAATATPAPVVEKHTKLEQFVDEDGRLHLKTVLE